MNNQVVNAQLMQKTNRLKVLYDVRKHPDTARPQISERTGLSMPSLTNIISYLTEVGILCENGRENVTRVGRKGVLLRLNASRFDLICIYLNDDCARVAKTDLEGNIKEKKKISIAGMASQDITEKLCEAVLSLADDNVLGIGIAISGLVLSDSRFVMSSRLKWKSFDVKNILEEKMGIPVFVDNLSVLKAVWYWNSHKTSNNEIFIDMENGIGAVQCVNGEVQKTVLGEIGHTTVDINGPQCFCGNRGCLETMCSPERLIYLYGSLQNGKNLSLSKIQKLYNEGDVNACSAVSHCSTYLGVGLANLVNLFNPSVMVINMGDFADCPAVLDEAEAEMKKRAYRSLTDGIEIIKVKETEESIIKGTAYNLFDKLFDISFEKNIIE